VNARRSSPPLRITSEDAERLRTLVEKHVTGRFAQAAELLEAELDRATVVPQSEMPANVATMRSRVVVEIVETGRRHSVQLVYPDEANVDEGRISVLAPMGIALLGLTVGDEMEWSMPGGRPSTVRIVSVLYQPEAAGDLDR